MITTSRPVAGRRCLSYIKTVDGIIMTIDIQAKAENIASTPMSPKLSALMNRPQLGL